MAAQFILCLTKETELIKGCEGRGKSLSEFIDGPPPPPPPRTRRVQPIDTVMHISKLIALWTILGHLR